MYSGRFNDLCYDSHNDFFIQYSCVQSKHELA